VAEGRKAVYGSVRRFLLLAYVPQQIRQFTSDAIASEPAADLLKSYSECMEAGGYPGLGNPGQTRERAEKLFGSRPAFGRASQPETHLAVADARCQKGLDVYQTLEGLTLTTASNWLAENSATLTELQDVLRESLRRAKALTSRGG
jgi:hypothetical protein